MSTPEPSFVLRSRESPVSALCPLPGGQHLILGHSDGTVSLWSFATRRQCGQAVVGHAKAVTEISATVEGGPIISQGRDGKIIQWRLDDPPSLQEGITLASCSEVSFCRIELWRVDGDEDPWRFAFVASNDAAIAVMRLGGTQPSCSSIEAPQDLGSCMALSALPCSRLAAGFESGHVVLFCLARSVELFRQRIFEEPVMALASAPRSARLCAASVGHRVLFLDVVAEGEFRESLACRVTNAGVSAVTWRGDGRMFALCGWDKRVRVVAAEGARTLAVLTTHRSRLIGAKFTRGGRLCVSDEVGTTSVWDLYPSD